MDRPWWRGAACYQIYPASFADADGDGLGDLRGITAHLDHLAGAPYSLGVDAVWLSPFYRSPWVDYGYDVSDHCAVDPRFGTLDDADVLVAEAHRRGLRVLLDFVPNHTSDQHPWFLAARRGRDDPHRAFYVWADPAADGGPPNNWLSAFPGVGPAWTLDERTGQYYLHSYTPAQPDLDWHNPDVRAAMCDVLRFWLRRGVDGFRVDAPHRLAKDPLLRDNPADVAGLRLDVQLDDRRHRNIDHPDVHEVMRLLRRTVDEFPGDRMLVGEVGIHHPGRLAAYVGAGDELHLAFTFAFWACEWSAAAFRAVVERAEATLPPTAWPTYALGNHDLPRAATRYADEATGAARLRLLATLLLTLRATAFLYYGEEVGMADVPVPAAAADDPNHRDPCRTPLPWTPGRGNGFTTGRPWRPLPGPTGPATVAEQRGDRGSLLALYRRLLRLRGRHPALRYGDYRSVEVGCPDVFCFERRLPGERLLVALNFGAHPVEVDLPAGLPAATDALLSPGAAGVTVRDGSRLALPPVDGLVARLA